MMTYHDICGFKIPMNNEAFHAVHKIGNWNLEISSYLITETVADRAVARLSLLPFHEGTALKRVAE